MKISSLTAVAVLASAATVFGHGVQIQLTFNPLSGKIETRQVVHTSAGFPNTAANGRPTVISPATRVYVMPLNFSPIGAGNGWYTRPDNTPSTSVPGAPEFPTGPGLTYQYDEAAQLPGTGWSYSGSTSLPNLQGTNFRYKFLGGLKFFDGTNPPTDPGLEQLQAFRGDGTAPFTISTTTQDAVDTTLALSNITSKSANAHSSIGFRLLGDGVSATVNPDDGVYVQQLQIETNATFGTSLTPVGASDPIWFVMAKTDLFRAIDVAATLGVSPDQIQVLPEPGSLLGIVAAGGLLVRRRRA